MVTSLKRLSAASKLMAATGNFSLPWANLKGKQAFFGLLRGLARLSSCRCTCCLHLRTWPNSSCCTALSAMPCLASMFSPLILRCNAATKRTASTNLGSHKMLKPPELASQAATHTSQNCRQCRNTIHFHTPPSSVCHVAATSVGSQAASPAFLPCPHHQTLLCGDQGLSLNRSITLFATCWRSLVI